MAAFTRTQADGTWITGYAILPADIEDLSRKCYEGINGDHGGVYTPTTELFVQGSSITFTGPVEIRQGGVVTGSVVLSGTEVERLADSHTGTTRTIWQSCAEFQYVGRHPWAVVPSLAPYGAHCVASKIDEAAGQYTPEFMVTLRVHDGATLSALRVRLQVPTEHPSVPAKMPRFRVSRRSYDGVVDYLTVGYDGFYELPKPSSGGDWHNDGVTQEFSIPCTQNNVIDVENYTYFVHVIEESVVSSGYPFSIRVFSGSVVNAYYDNQSLFPVTGLFTLLTGQDDKSENGLWADDGAGGSERRPDLSTSNQFKDGMIFFLEAASNAQHMLTFQMRVPPDFEVDSSPIEIGPIVPRGTLFLGFLLDFTDIADNRFQ